jgi:hypothetical protein
VARPARNHQELFVGAKGGEGRESATSEAKKTTQRFMVKV